MRWPWRAIFKLSVIAKEKKKNWEYSRTLSKLEHQSPWLAKNYSNQNMNKHSGKDTLLSSETRTAAYHIKYNLITLPTLSILTTTPTTNSTITIRKCRFAPNQSHFDKPHRLTFQPENLFFSTYLNVLRSHLLSRHCIHRDQVQLDIQCLGQHSNSPRCRGHVHMIQIDRHL